jgi:hypothetical protein
MFRVVGLQPLVQRTREMMEVIERDGGSVAGETEIKTHQHRRVEDGQMGEINIQHGYDITHSAATSAFKTETNDVKRDPRSADSACDDATTGGKKLRCAAPPSKVGSHHSTSPSFPVLY